MHCHIIIAVILWSVGIESRKLRGISLSYKRFYRERKSFLCIDGSKMIPFEQVNDDYCDCADGSDEPGTSACPNGRFYCANLGFRPHYIPSSRVNDGICDCCDASDEYNSHTRCQNSCRNLGRRERAEVEGQMRTLDEGLRLKQQHIEEGVTVWREKQAQLRDLQRLSEDLQTKLEEHRRSRGEAERLTRQERKAPEAEDNVYYQLCHALFLHICNRRAGRYEGCVIVRTCVGVYVCVVLISVSFPQALLGGNRQVDLSRLQTTLWSSPQVGDSVKIKGGRAAPGSRTDEDPDIKAAVSAGEKERADVQKIEEAYKNVNLEIRELTEKLSIDYGTEKEFLFLGSLCFQLKVDEYTYTLCPFNQVTQKSAAGTEVSLGKWGTWAGSPENQYCQMRYESGELCWQGPTRNTMVTLTCGTETALRSVREPSKCQYVMDLQTPAACHPALRPRGVHSEL
ncbi:LOW QUALITY PROTEIN: glucosidase 2 subunit beta-like [Hypomesus transpacificus]|uniref:LOW QUALITY PROTEIN: glucosidase 2 subunit beta-like n=1 Tax=Hypomesus transpacificus TaxID=137520 RepID=UPI001F07B1B3|nr:LOW QUALITY PROTEIN: glucosidase 2 subunit beta-like [Hypomesus transpacificus]